MRREKVEGGGPGPDPDPDQDQGQETEAIAGRSLRTLIKAGIARKPDKISGLGPGVGLVGEAVGAGRGMDGAERESRPMKGEGMEGMQQKIGPNSYQAMTQW